MKLVLAGGSDLVFFKAGGPKVVGGHAEVLRNVKKEERSTIMKIDENLKNEFWYCILL